MALIGNPLITTNYITDSLSGDNSTVAFTLSQAPASAQSIAVFISGLYQIPTSAYSISGTTLTFTAAPPTGTSNILVLHLGVQNQNLVPSAASITPAMLNNANVIYWSTSNNNIGIGNTTPTRKVSIDGGSSTATAIYLKNSNLTSGVDIEASTTDFRIQQRDALPIVLLTNNAIRTTISANGNVGVANTSPAAPLHVTRNTNNGTIGEVARLDAGTQNPSVSGSGAALNIMTNSGANYYGAFGGYSDGTNYVAGIWGGGAASGTPTISVTSAGKVGIGNTAPAFIQQNHSATENDVSLCLSTTSNSSTAGSLGLATRLRLGTLSTATNNGVTEIRSLHNLYQDALSALAFYTHNGTSLGERVRITADGNVGIGTSSPDNNAGYIALSISGSTGGQIYWRSTGSSVSAYAGADVNGGYIATLSNHPLLFRTNNTTRAGITTGGDFQFNSGYGSVATAYGCRAWVNFNGSGTIAIRNSKNVSSISDAGEMYYGINFSSAMPDANYVWFANGSNVNDSVGTNYTGYFTTTPGNNQTTSYLYIKGLNIYNGGANFSGDPPLVTVGIIR